MKPPTFFLSSTIYDFKDLRSAIKYYLEQQGCRVLASEFNDFSKPLDTHSYEACLNAINEADFFVLLIGSRVGGWFDEPNRVSITQQEYRTAYKLHGQGQLKLLSFVRSEVWRMKEDRKELARHLDALGIDPAVKTQITKYPSKSATDADFIIGFLNEVGRNKETLAARAEGRPLPTGNWIHIFDSFEEVIEAIQLQAFAGIPVEEATLRRLLRQELQEFLRISLVKTSGGTACSPRPLVDAFHDHHSLTNDDKYKSAVTVHTELFDRLCSWSFHLMNLGYYPQILPRAIESPVFLTFDPVAGGLNEEPVHKALQMLHGEIRKFTKANQWESLRIVFETSPKALPVRGDRLRVDPPKLFCLLHLLDRWCNIISLCKAIINHLDGQPFMFPSLRPRSPIDEMNDSLDKEDATEADVDVFLRI